MQFVQRIRTIWSWLPAFRAVAETEHLPTAAQELNVVPSSLSRMVKLLEDEVGVSLFDRATKALVLNETGRRLLAATRDAMRIVDEALVAVDGTELRGPITAIASRDLAYAVLPRACASIAERHTNICVSIAVDDDVNIPALLLRGDADVAVMLQPPTPSADLVILEASQWTRAVYARANRTVDVGAMRFVGIGGTSKPTDDGWPVTHDRTVGAWASDQGGALQIVARSSLIAIAFDPVARASNVFHRIVRLPTPVIEPCPVYVVHRRAVHRHHRTELLVEAIHASLQRLAQG